MRRALISDVQAISLRDQEGSGDIPGYRSLQFFPAEKVQAALGRRIFEASSQPEAVDYTHRTTAEFLAAQFLAARVRAGLPFGRVKALIGVDGHPATELRGLYAWLAVHLPERADELIDGDPYGVLTYGDAASLSSSLCAALIRALAKLGQRNPWFRSGNWQANSIGALARSDMVREFKTILNDPDAGFGIRSVVVDALALGTPLPEMLADLEVVLAREASPFAECLHALEALLRLGDAGKTAVLSLYRDRLGTSVNDLRLREQIVRAFYGNPFGPNDVITLVNASLQADDAPTTTLLWRLADYLPLEDLPAILDGVAPLPRSARDNRRLGRWFLLRPSHRARVAGRRIRPPAGDGMVAQARGIRRRASRRRHAGRARGSPSLPGAVACSRKGVVRDSANRRTALGSTSPLSRSDLLRAGFIAVGANCHRMLRDRSYGERPTLFSLRNRN